MGKHDSDESMGFFLGGAESIKNGALWLLHNIKILAFIALIPIVGFGAYYGAKYFANKSGGNPTTQKYAVAGKISSEDDTQKKEYLGGYEVIGSIKASYIGLDCKIVNPVISGTTYLDDSLNYGAVLYNGNKVNGDGNIAIIGHNTATVFLGLKNIELDNEIIVTDSKGNEIKYTVIEKKDVEPDDMSVLLPMEENSKEITLITCESEGTTRLVVKAIAK